LLHVFSVRASIGRLLEASRQVANDQPNVSSENGISSQENPTRDAYHMPEIGQSKGASIHAAAPPRAMTAAVQCGTRPVKLSAPNPETQSANPMRSESRRQREKGRIALL
jgi:hypothetical protein